MCLVLSNIDFDQSLVHKVYKVVRRRYNRYVSPHMEHEWFFGENISSRNFAILETERAHGTVSFGFHFFLHMRDAINDVKWHKQSGLSNAEFTILECEVKPEDFVAKGTYNGVDDIPDADCVVYTKCNVEKIALEL